MSMTSSQTVGVSGGHDEQPNSWSAAGSLERLSLQKIAGELWRRQAKVHGMHRMSTVGMPVMQPSIGGMSVHSVSITLAVVASLQIRLSEDILLLGECRAADRECRAAYRECRVAYRVQTCTAACSVH